MINGFHLARAASAALLGFSLACSAEDPQAMPDGLGEPGAATVRVNGAGATFPKPLYERWMQAYADVHPEVVFRYEGVGSGQGIKRFLAEEVDFGASDAAMSDADLAKVGDRGAVMVPMTAGMVVLAYNLPGVDALNLSRDAVTGIFSGEIQSWDDERIQTSNPGITLPKKTIAPVVRRDSSGTTFIFTNHLSAASDWWRSQGPGTAKRIDWPGGIMEVNYNEGVAQRVKISAGSIGYMEYEFAERLGLPVATLENKAGRMVAPSPAAGTAALASAPGDPRRPSRVRAGPPRRRRLSHRQLHLVAALRRVSRRQQGRGAQGCGDLGSDRGPAHRRADGVHSAAGRDGRAGEGQGSDHQLNAMAGVSKTLPTALSR